MIQVFSESNNREIAEIIKWFRQFKRYGDTGELPAEPLPATRINRWAKTSITSKFPNYPSDGNILPIVLGKYTYDPLAPPQTARTYANRRKGPHDFVPYKPEKGREACFFGGWVPEGTLTRVSLHNGQWFAVDSPLGVIHCKAPSGGIPGASGSTMGKAECEMFNSTRDTAGDVTLAAILGTTGNPIVRFVYNKSTTAVAASAQIMAAIDMSGFYFAIWEDCT